MSTELFTTPSAAPPRRPRADAERNRQKVMTAARATFAEDGLDAQMDAIARRAGVGVGTVYRHFPTKETLVDALWADKWERVTAIAREALENPDPWEAIVEMFTRGATMQAEDLAWCQAFGPRCPAELPSSHAPAGLIDVTNALLDRAKQAGVLRKDFSFEDVGQMFCAVGAVIDARGPEARHGFLRVMLAGLHAQAVVER